MNHWSNLTCVGSWGHPVTVQTAVVWTKAAARSGANTRMRFFRGQAAIWRHEGKIQEQKDKNSNGTTFSNISRDQGVLLERRLLYFTQCSHNGPGGMNTSLSRRIRVLQAQHIQGAKYWSYNDRQEFKRYKHKTHTRTAKIIGWDWFNVLLFLLFFVLPFLKNTTDNTLHCSILLWFCVVYSISC